MKVHPVNRLLQPFGIGLFRRRRYPIGFEEEYRKNLARVRSESGGFDVVEELYCDVGDHPLTYKDFECGFAAAMLSKFRPKSVLDIGSYREFVHGISSAYSVTILDVRESQTVNEGQRVVVSDAKRMVFDSGSFDCVVSLSSIEHFGLGRYGDEFDLKGDWKAFSEFKRCLRPGGILIVTTTVTAGRPAIAFNAHRIYGKKQLEDLAAPFELVEERFYNRKLARWCEFSELPTAVGEWGVYCGCWRKPT